MRLLDMKWKNFGSYYGVHTFQMQNQGLVLIKGNNLDEPKMDSNGSGKSTIFDAIDWCWFGVSPRGTYSESMVNEETLTERGGACSVETSLLDDDGKMILIERGRTKSKNWCKVSADGKDVSSLDVKETQKTIERLLGLNRETFHAAVLFAQDDLVHYASATDAVKMRILTQILQLEQIDQYLDLAKARLKDNKSRQVGLEQRILVLRSKLDAMRQIDFKSAIESWDRTRRQRLDSINQKQQALRSELMTIKPDKDLNALLARETHLKSCMGAGSYIRPVALAEAMTRMEQVGRQHEQARAVHSAEVRRIQMTMSKFSAMREGVCSQCGQRITAQHLSNEIANLGMQLAPIQTSLQAIDQMQRQTNEEIMRLQQEDAREKAAYDSAYAAQANDLARLSGEIIECRGRQNRSAQIEREIALCQDEALRITNEKNPNLEQQARHIQELDKIEQQLQDEEQSLATVVDSAKYLDFWVSAFGVQGLKSYILDSRLQELTDAANQWVRILTGGTIWVRFESQKKKRKSSDLVNAPDLRVFRWNPNGTVTERLFRDWSGGEKQRISFAVDFGLTRLIAQRASKVYNFLGLDEAFKHLDRSGKEAVMDLLQQFAEEKESVLVVEHDDAFKSQFDKAITVTKKNGRSTLEYDDEQAQA